MPIVSLLDIREDLPAVAQLPDGKLTAMRSRVETAIARHLYVLHDAGNAPSLDSAARTLYLDGPMEDHPERLDLWGHCGLPVTAVSAVAEDDVGDRTYSSTVTAGDYELVDERTLELIPTASHAWGTGRRLIRVSCTAGYSTTEPPQDLVDAILMTWRATWMERAGRTGQSSDPAADVLTVRVRIPPAARDLLAYMQRWGGMAG